MHSNLFMYLTAMSAVSIHNLVNNINEATRSVEPIELRTANTNWTIDDIDTIPNEYNNYCNGTRQSPININTSAVRENINLRLGLTAYDKPISGFMINQFPTFRLMPFSFEWPRPSALVSNSLARSFNPYADSHFVLNYVQFHWTTGHGGSNDSSVHRLDNSGCPLEIHFVHINTAYSNLEEAFAKPDGLLILAVMVVPSTHESYICERLLNSLSNITLPGQQVAIDEDSTWRSLLPTDTSRFYRYQGSMILPPCHESVQWIVFEERLKLGSKQLRRLKRFRFLGKDLRSDRDIDWTLKGRPSQKLNNRIVERSFSSRLGKERSRNKAYR